MQQIHDSPQQINSKANKWSLRLLQRFRNEARRVTAPAARTYTFSSFILHSITDMTENCGRSVWAEFLTDDPAAWKVRVGEHYMFREDETQLDIGIERILFHPDRNRKRW